MTHASENMNSAGAEEEHQRESTQERPADTVARVFDEIKSIEEQAEPKPDARVAEMALRLGVDEAQLESVEQVVRFAERSRALTEKFHGIKDKFQENIRRTLLPVATALAMNSAPALAQEANTERPTTNGPETVLATKSESRELKKEDVFDVSSPLNITGEKMKTLKREMLPEELALMKELHKKVWQEKNEWAASSWIDGKGSFVTELTEGNRYSVTTVRRMSIFEQSKKNESHAHTHPRESNTFSTTPGPQPDVMPPSGGDISHCADTSLNAMTFRVVDPRGVWEFQCDKQSSFIGIKKKVTDGIENIGLSRGLEQDGMAKLKAMLQNALRENNPTDMLAELAVGLSILDKEYPGIKETSEALTSELTMATHERTKEILENEQWAGWLMRNSSHYSNDELVIRIKNYIESGEKRGVYMSYTPFKELPKDKESQKE